MRTRLILPILAVAAALVPLPAAIVERWYSQGLYPPLQRGVTTLSNVVSIALLDVAAIALIGYFAARTVMRWRRDGRRAALTSAAWFLVSAASVVYLIFLASWGLNYRRVALERKVVFSGERIPPEAARRFAWASVEQVNGLARLRASDRPDERALARSFFGTLRALGVQRLPQTARPKLSLLNWYFPRAGFDGMTDPIFLEIILNPELLPFERPFVIAHEWAHLAGYADESEASFVAWLACVRGDPAAQYSGWLFAYQHVAGRLPRPDRIALRNALQPSVLADLAMSAERLERVSPAVRNVARDAYDGYLRANRVEGGIENYEQVVRFMLGTAFDEGWTPRLRR